MIHNWVYRDADITELTDFPSKCVGFIYRITNVQNGKFYIGKKILQTNRKKKLTKREIAEHTAPGRKPTSKRVVAESNWKTYFGSSEELLKDIKQVGSEHFRREILHLCYNKKQLTYYEVYYQMQLRVLHIDSYNSNVLAKFFRKDLEQE